MSFKIAGKLLQNKTARKLALVYGVIMVNVGAILLYNKFSVPKMVFDQGFNISVVCLVIGLVILFFVKKHNGEP